MAPFSPQDCAALRRELESLADPAYKAFNEACCQGWKPPMGYGCPKCGRWRRPFCGRTRQGSWSTSSPIAMRKPSCGGW